MIFKTLSLLYPEFLRGRSDEDIKFTKRLWLQQLEGCRADCVEQTLNRVPDRFPSFAPKVGEFKQLMPKIERPKLQAVARSDYVPPARSEKVEKFRDELASLVGAKRITQDEGEEK